MKKLSFSLLAALLLSACAETINEQTTSTANTQRSTNQQFGRLGQVQILPNTTNGACSLTPLTQTGENQYGSYVEAGNEHCSSTSYTRQVLEYPVTVINNNNRIQVHKAYISWLDDRVSSTFIEFENISGEVLCPNLNMQAIGNDSTVLHDTYWYQAGFLVASNAYLALHNSCLMPQESAVLFDYNSGLDNDATISYLQLELAENDGYQFAPSAFTLTSVTATEKQTTVGVSLNPDMVGIGMYSQMLVQDASGYFIDFDYMHRDVETIFKVNEASMPYNRTLTTLQPGDKLYMVPDLFPLEKIGPLPSINE
ncbi:hypothetical protein [Salinibius halmophilus]|uniref:hypothetical protein n=1 Tax=Salinibius halmophilus TaxID=1853216 RepID=UPI000E66BE43|nr:hypothetical protein [Salinibius halmophilus]